MGEIHPVNRKQKGGNDTNILLSRIIKSFTFPAIVLAFAFPDPSLASYFRHLIYESFAPLTHGVELGKSVGR